MHTQSADITVRRWKGRAMADIWVGLSGWSYANWRGAFYPPALPSREYLAFYAREFKTTEINSSFYHFPRPQTYERWAAQVPDGFVFAVKANRVLTHTRRLQEVEEPWLRFVQAVAPPSLVFTCERFFTAPFLALSPFGLLTATFILPLLYIW